jgi:rhomboid protease GluP
MFIRNESFSSFLRHYPLISFIIAINLLIFLTANLFPAPIGGQFGYVVSTMVGWNAGIAKGEYWRLITPIFLHIGFAHVLFNSFSTILFGPALERILGKGKFIVAYLGTGIIANLATYWLKGPGFSHLGASGAIFGLFGLYVYMVLYRKDLIDRANSQVVMTILVIGVVMTFFNSNINILGHLFGLIGGLLLAPPLLARVPLDYGWRPLNIERRPNPNTGVTFNPNRWKKHRRTNKIIPKILWGGLGVLVLIGLLSNFL